MRSRSLVPFVVFASNVLGLSTAVAAVAPAPVPVPGGDVEIRIVEGGVTARTTVYRLARPDEHGKTSLKLGGSSVVDGRPRRIEVHIALELRPDPGGRPRLEYVVRRVVAVAKDKAGAIGGAGDIDVSGSMLLPPKGEARTLARAGAGTAEGGVSVELEVLP